MNKVYSLLPPHISEFIGDDKNLVHQSITILTVSSITGYLLYLGLSAVAFVFLFDKKLMKHPKFLPGQVWREIHMGLYQVPLAALYTLPFWLLEINGYSKIYHDPSEHGLAYMAFSVVAFLVFSDFFIYWIHRIEHHPKLYWWLHKPHHTWKVPTPFASFAFHPLDGYLQSTPYHIFPFILPLQAHLYLGLFMFVQMWTIGIHDNVFWTANNVINGAAHHTIHHLEFNYNYGQYFTFWDRMFGTHKFPNDQKQVREYFEQALRIKSD